ncbi:2OG-Fe(II) oxygenase family protein [bacterium]|jgi:hypothetical protein|nr:2OG-Fe(II) oxygenase family protein [bacterium]
MKLNVIKPFGPSILLSKIPEKIVNDLNNYVDEIIGDKKKLDELDYGNKLAGNVTQEFRLEKNFIKNIGWLDFLGKCVYAWVERELNIKISKFELLETWIVRQFENEYNPVHFHSGHVSGAGYLKVPNNLGKYIQNKKKNNFQGGDLNLIHGSKQFLSNSIFQIKPKVGDFYFFPNYLMHTVYPFNGTKEERRSISFNAKIDDQIYNKGI